MRVDEPQDLAGRMIQCEQRAKLIGMVLQNSARRELADADSELLDSLMALGQIAAELAEEINAIENIRIDREDEAYFRDHPEIAAITPARGGPCSAPGPSRP